MKISVITAAYNCVDTIGDAIDSVRSQHYPNIEHVLIDGASTDGTREAITGYLDAKSRFVSEPDQGIYDALNKGIGYASGDVIGFLHADDLFAAPDTLSRVARAFEDPLIDAVYGDLVYVRKENTDVVVRWWTAGEFTPAALARGWMPPHPTVYVRRSVYERLGVFDTTLKIAADYDFMLRMLASGTVGTAYIPEVMVRMRVGGASNKSLGNIVRKSREDFRAMRRHGISAVQALTWKNLSKMSQFLPARRI